MPELVRVPNKVRKVEDLILNCIRANARDLDIPEDAVRAYVPVESEDLPAEDANDFTNSDEVPPKEDAKVKCGNPNASKYEKPEESEEELTEAEPSVNGGSSQEELTEAEPSVNVGSSQEIHTSSWWRNVIQLIMGKILGVLARCRNWIREAWETVKQWFLNLFSH